MLNVVNRGIALEVGRGVPAEPLRANTALAPSARREAKDDDGSPKWRPQMHASR